MELVDIYPKPRCRNCGYVESCCQPELPCDIGNRETDQTKQNPADASAPEKSPPAIT
jgi:hypothetical protein